MSHKAVSYSLVVKQKCPYCEKEWFISDGIAGNVGAAYPRHLKAAHPKEQFTMPFFDHPGIPTIHGSVRGNKTRLDKVIKSSKEEKELIKMEEKSYADMKECVMEEKKCIGTK